MVEPVVEPHTVGAVPIFDNAAAEHGVVDSPRVGLGGVALIRTLRTAVQHCYEDCYSSKKIKRARRANTL